MSKRRRAEEDEENLSGEETSNGLVQRQSSGIPLLPRELEPSIFGIQPNNDFVRVVSDFLFMHVGKENVEVIIYYSNYFKYLTYFSLILDRS
jgi:hypothetical protein